MVVQVRVFPEGLGAHYADRGEEGAVGGADGVCGERDRRAENLAEKMGGQCIPGGWQTSACTTRRTPVYEG